MQFHATNSWETDKSPRCLLDQGLDAKDKSQEDFYMMYYEKESCTRTLLFSIKRTIRIPVK